MYDIFIDTWYFMATSFPDGVTSNREKMLYSELQEKQGSMFYVLSSIVSSDS